MYNDFYGFSENPFDLIPDPKFLYLTWSHREALASMTHGIKNRNGFISLTGNVGSGKTSLIHSLLDNLGEKVKSVHLVHTTLTFNELLRTILSELHLAIEKEETTDLLHQLTQYLLQISSRDEMLLIIIDEAQDLPSEVLKDFERLIPLGSKGMKLIFVGQPGFEDKLNSEGFKPLNQSVEIRRQIRGFDDEESAKYIEHRLKLVGKNSSEIFSPEAISLICRYSRGIPRVINTLCDNALLTGFRLSQKKIDADTVRGAIKNLEGPASRKTILSPATVASMAGTFHALPSRMSFFLKKRFMLIPLALLCFAVIIFVAYKNLPPRSAEIREIKSLKIPEVGPNPSPAPAVSPKPVSAKPPSSLPVATPGREYSLKKIVGVKKGQTISQLAHEYYGMVNLTLIDLLLELNPAITNVHLILVDQEIKIPNLTEALLLIRSPDQTYEIHAGTFDASDAAKFYADERISKGRKVEVLPRKVSPRDTWHRVVIGNFGNKEEALKMVYLLKEKGLLPAFGGVLK